MKLVRDGVFRYGDNPTDVIGKYINGKPITIVTLNQHAVYFYSDETILATVYDPENYSAVDDDHKTVGVIYSVPDSRTFLSKNTITPDLIGTVIRTKLGPDLQIETYEVGGDYVNFVNQGNITTVPFEGLSYWWTVE